MKHLNKCVFAVISALLFFKLSYADEYYGIQFITSGGYHHDYNMAADGSYLVFDKDDNIFVYNREQGITEPISVGINGAEADGVSYDPSISADGRYVVFSSSATNLVEGDINGSRDIFTYDRETATTELSIANSINDSLRDHPHHISAQISADGQYIVFSSYASDLSQNDTNRASDIFIYDRSNGVIEKISTGIEDAETDGDSYNPIVSYNGNHIVFGSDATNLVSNDTNENPDIFIYHKDTDTIERITSICDDPIYCYFYDVAISADGRYVTYGIVQDIDEDATSSLHVYDQGTGLTDQVDFIKYLEESYRSISTTADGRYVVFSGSDAKERQDVYLYDQETQAVRRLSISNTGERGNSYSYYPNISANGHYVAFSSSATNLVEEAKAGLYLVTLGDNLLKNGEADDKLGSWDTSDARAGVCKVKKDACFKLLQGTLSQTIDLTNYTDRIAEGLPIKIRAKMKVGIMKEDINSIKKATKKSFVYPVVYVSFTDANGETLQEQNLEKATSQKWMTDTLETVVPATATQMTISLMLESETSKKTKKATYGTFDSILVVISKE